MTDGRTSRQRTTSAASDPAPGYLLTSAAAFLALPLLSACGGGGGSTGPDDPDDDDGSGQAIASVTVSPDTAAASELGETVQFEAEARDAEGNTVSGVSFSWTSTDGSVATVGGGGTATAQSNGASRIQASASGVTGSAYLAVRAGELTWVRIRAGNIFGCGLTTHGTAACWGDNVHGELGNGETTQTQLTPVRVESPLYFVQLSLGGGHTCALTWDRTTFCWGNSSFGEGGYGEETGVQTHPMEVSGGHRFQQIAASGNHTCAVRTDGTAYCWGLNSRGQLGNGTTRNRSTPVRVSGGHTFESISAPAAPSDNHTCGVTEGGDVYCWGVNASGELGDRTTEDRLEPVRLAGDLAFSDVAAGGAHTCALTEDGIVHCWGGNSSGQLGDGTTEDRVEPVQVSGGLQFQAIAAGNRYTCALAADSTAYCWGSNGRGQLGDGTTENRTVPIQVSGGLVFRHIEVGETHTCGTTTDGAGYCWGHNRQGKLGTGDAVDRAEPARLLDPGEVGG